MKYKTGQKATLHTQDIRFRRKNCTAYYPYWPGTPQTNKKEVTLTQHEAAALNRGSRFIR